MELCNLEAVCYVALCSRRWEGEKECAQVNPHPLGPGEGTNSPFMWGCGEQVQWVLVLCMDGGRVGGMTKVRVV